MSWQARLLDVIFRVVLLKKLFDVGSIDWVIRFNRKQGRARPRRRLRELFDVKVETRDGHDVTTISPRGRSSRRKILYLHGGGFVLSMVPGHWRLIYLLAKKLDATVVVPHYPLSPEHTADQVHDWLVSVYGHVVDDERWWIMGDSAGGNLSMTITLGAAAKGHRAPKGLVLFSPGLVDEREHPLRLQNDLTDRMIALRGLEPMVRRYKGALDDDDARVSPLVKPLPRVPILAFASTSEVLYVDTLRLQEKAAAEGADVEVRFYDGMCHVWPLFPIPESLRAVDDVTAFVTKHDP